jgi:hypothetical protein
MLKRWRTPASRRRESAMRTAIWIRRCGLAGTLFERRLCRRNLLLGGGSEAAVEAPFD